MSAAVMPMRSVPCAKAGVAEAARRPRGAARRRRLNIHYSPVRERDMQGPSQANAACRLHALWLWEGQNVVAKGTNSGGIPGARRLVRAHPDARGHRASPQGLRGLARSDAADSHPLGLGSRTATRFPRRRIERAM